MKKYVLLGVKFILNHGTLRLWLETLIMKIAYTRNVVGIHNLDGKPLNIEESVSVGDTDNDVV